MLRYLSMFAVGLATATCGGGPTPWRLSCDFRPVLRWLHLDCAGWGALCSGMWVLTQVPEQFDPSMLDTEALAQAFSVGFGLVATVLVGALGVKAVLDFLKKNVRSKSMKKLKICSFVVVPPLP
ncbi:hypothetical protein [Pseudomonas aeruginosa]|uniref:hypothetical protein n=1 Tax=Pseudomonas aeruginosa TaxID=287 RepID=UPI00211E0D15|nr:hypothetical protein [Pseudomonas aeruginosa]